MSHHRFRSLLCLLFLFVSVSMTEGRTVAAAVDDTGRSQNENWTTVQLSGALQLRVENDAVVTADDFAGAFGDELITVFDELLLFFHVVDPVQPITLSFYDDIAAYRQAVDAIDRAEVDGQIAIADPLNATIVLPVDTFGGLARFDAENQLRHALAHIVLGWASDFALPWGFDEGLAHYVETPNIPVLARSVALVHAAQQNDNLDSWASLNREDTQPETEIARAERYAMVAWLIEYRGLPDLWVFLEASKTADSWREALTEAVAPTTVDELERQWQTAIPSWATGGWRANLMTGFDLAPAREQLERGNFAGAARALDASEQLLRDIDDPEWALEVARLKDQARIGDLAERKMIEAQESLEQFVYDRAAAAVEQAEGLYAQLPTEGRPEQLLAVYADMAARGLAATNDLQSAHDRAGNWLGYANARSLAQRAGNEFASLGDVERHTDADLLIQSLDDHQLRVVLLLLALAVFVGGWLVVWLVSRGRQPLRWE